MLNNILRSLIIAMLMAHLTIAIVSDTIFADPLEDPFAADDRGDYATTVRLLRPLAEQGNAQVQNSIGAMYYNGKGVGMDFKEAFKWHQLAAALLALWLISLNSKKHEQWRLGVKYQGTSIVTKLFGIFDTHRVWSL